MTVLNSCLLESSPGFAVLLQNAQDFAPNYPSQSHKRHAVPRRINRHSCKNDLNSCQAVLAECMICVDLEWPFRTKNGRARDRIPTGRQNRQIRSDPEHWGRASRSTVSRRVHSTRSGHSGWSEKSSSTDRPRRTNMRNRHLDRHSLYVVVNLTMSSGDQIRRFSADPVALFLRFPNFASRPGCEDPRQTL